MTTMNSHDMVLCIHMYIYNIIQYSICVIGQRHANTQMCTRLIEGVNYIFLGRLIRQTGAPCNLHEIMEYN